NLNKKIKDKNQVSSNISLSDESIMSFLKNQITFWQSQMVDVQSESKQLKNENVYLRDEIENLKEKILKISSINYDVTSKRKKRKLSDMEPSANLSDELALDHQSGGPVQKKSRHEQSEQI
ncbi:hypothetical protein RFI_28957, partial [Reticulomyxa filosa]